MASSYFFRQSVKFRFERIPNRAALGMKVSDEFTVSLCRGHHRRLHHAVNEQTWWPGLKITPLVIAKVLWAQTHPNSAETVETQKSKAVAVRPDIQPANDKSSAPTDHWSRRRQNESAAQ
jgi:hypothetical protein